MQQQHFSLRNHWYRRGLALLLVLILGIGLAQPALAAITIITDQASCEAFGGRWHSLYGCQKFSTTIATGNTLTIQTPSDFDVVTNNGTFEVQSFLLVNELTNNTGATINISGRLDVTGGGFTNAGVMNLTNTMIMFNNTSTNAGTGQIYVRNGATLSLQRGSITNEGVIRVECGGAIVYNGFMISGNPPQDLCPPSVTVNQAAGQADPTNRNPLRFTANFGQAVADFTAVDIILGGTADRSGATVTVSGGPSSYTISVNGITSNGTVTVAVPANAVTDAEGQRNPASSSTDNSVTYLADFTPPVTAPSQSPTANANGWHNRDVQVAWNWSDPNGTDAATCTTHSTSSGEGDIDLTATCRDVVGNEGRATYRVRVDKTRPTGNPSPNPAANSNGWHNRDVQVAWNWVDPSAGAGQVSGLDPATCPPTTLVTSEGRTTLDQLCFDRAGNEMRSVYTVNLDKTPPTANPTLAPAANANGWHNSDVTVTWNWRDPAPSAGPAAGLDPANCPLTATSSGEGSRTLNGACSDRAGNRTEQSYTVLVDKTAPVVTVTGVSNGAVYTLGSVPAAGCNTTDVRSGVATQATLSLTGGNGDGTGSFTATCSPATDLAGNSSTAVSVDYTVNAPSTPTPTSTSLPTSTDTPEPTATPTSTSSPTPTNTPEPTATPTNTPEPTATPGGTLIGGCGPYAVYQNGTTYSAVGWAGTILVGTNGNNTLNGGSGADLILGLGGNDLLKGNGGNDVLCGGDGVDLLQGHGGNDRLDGGNDSDVLNGGSGDYDELLAGDGNDVLLDGDGVLAAAGGAGNDLFTLALRNGWRDATGQARFGGLSGGYGNDAVGLAILNPVSFLVDITGDERDNPASPREGTNDTLALVGVINPISTLLKFEHQVVLSATSEAIIPGEESGAEYLTEPVGEESEPPIEQVNRLFLPLVNR